MSAGQKVRCLTCNTVIQSMYRHDFVGCKCPQDGDTWIAVDGGDSYFKMSFKPESKWEELIEKSAQDLTNRGK